MSAIRLDELTDERQLVRSPGGHMAGAGPRRFEEFFADEQARLFGALCLVTGSRHEAEEIGQEAFARMWEHWPRVSAMDEPTGYLYRVAMNVFRSQYRRALVAARRLTAASPARDELEAVEDRDEVARVLSKLIPQQRAAIVLTGMLGFSSDEAGAMLGMKGSTVRVLTTRARAELRGGQEVDA
jgi:RNA polymerase sigma-70 factor (ECF subfamily)